MGRNANDDIYIYRSKIREKKLDNYVRGAGARKTRTIIVHRSEDNRIYISENRSRYKSSLYIKEINKTEETRLSILSIYLSIYVCISMYQEYFPLKVS